LTEAGGRFFADVTLGLSHIRKSAEELKALGGGLHVTLSASAAFASFWMVPRLQKFRDELPGIDLRIQTADRDLDLVAEGIPLSIRGGSAQDWPDYDLLTIAPEEIYAVAGPSYVARSGMPRTLTDLANERLIHLEEPFRPAANWSEWFQSAGFGGAVVSRGLLINDYVSVIQAVMEGQGVALGWRHLTDRLIASGLLVRVSDHVMATGQGFHVAWPKNRALSENARRVRDWFAAQA
jgi:DNA-binding transcriptional LysR family regulator